MSNDVLNYARETEPGFKDVSDKELTEFIWDSFPEFREDKEFADSYRKMFQPPKVAQQVQSGDIGKPLFYQDHTKRKGAFFDASKDYVRGSSEFLKLYEGADPARRQRALQQVLSDWDKTEGETEEQKAKRMLGMQQSFEREKQKALAEGESGWAYFMERVPFIGSQLNSVKLAQVGDAANRIDANDYGDGPFVLDQQMKDVELVGQYLAELEREESKGFLRKTADLATAIPAFGVEFMTTAGGYFYGKQAVEQGLKKVTSRMVKRKIENKMVNSVATKGMKLTGFLGGAATQAVIMPHMVSENFFQTLAQDKILVGKDDKGKLSAIISDEDPSFGRAAYEAYTKTFVETASERTGLVLGKVFNKTAGTVAEKVAPGLKAAIARRWLKLNPSKSTKDLVDAVATRAGWSGVIGEVLEERVAEAGRAALTRDPYPNRTAGEWLEQLSMEGLAFSVPGTGAAIIDKVGHYVDSREYDKMMETLAIETGNTAALMGTLPPKEKWEEDESKIAVADPIIIERPDYYGPKAYINTPNKGFGDSTEVAYLSGNATPGLKNRAEEWGDVGLMLTPAKREYVDQEAENYPYFAVDNGAFAKGGFKPSSFNALLDRVEDNETLKEKVLFVVAPDTVGNAEKTLKQFKTWEPKIRERGLPVAFVAQDGLENRLNEIPWNKIDVLFVGGTTNWKSGKFDDAELPEKSRLNWELIFDEARAREIPIHMGRVNSNERLNLHSTDISAARNLVWGHYYAQQKASTVDGTMLAHDDKKKVLEDDLFSWLGFLNESGLTKTSRTRHLNEQNFPEIGRLPTDAELVHLAFDPDIKYEGDLGGFEGAFGMINAIRKSYSIEQIQKGERPEEEAAEQTPEEVDEVQEDNLLNDGVEIGLTYEQSVEFFRLAVRTTLAEKDQEEKTKDPVTGEEFTAFELMDQLESEGKPRMGEEFSRRRGYSKRQIEDWNKRMELIEELTSVEGVDLAALQVWESAISAKVLGKEEETDEYALTPEEKAAEEEEYGTFDEVEETPPTKPETKVEEPPKEAAPEEAQETQVDQLDWQPVVDKKNQEAVEFKFGKNQIWGIRRQKKRKGYVYRAASKYGDTWSGFTGLGQGEFTTYEGAENALAQRVIDQLYQKDFETGEFANFATPAIRQQVIEYQKGFYSKAYTSEEQIEKISGGEVKGLLDDVIRRDSHGRNAEGLRDAFIAQQNIGRRVLGMPPLPKTSAEAGVGAPQADAPPIVGKEKKSQSRLELIDAVVGPENFLFRSRIPKLIEDIETLLNYDFSAAGLPPLSKKEAKAARGQLKELQRVRKEYKKWHVDSLNTKGQTRKDRIWDLKADLADELRERDQWIDRFNEYLDDGRQAQEDESEPLTAEEFADEYGDSMLGWLRNLEISDIFIQRTRKTIEKLDPEFNFDEYLLKVLDPKGQGESKNPARYAYGGNIDPELALARAYEYHDDPDVTGKRKDVLNDPRVNLTEESQRDVKLALTKLAQPKDQGETQENVPEIFRGYGTTVKERIQALNDAKQKWKDREIPGEEYMAQLLELKEAPEKIPDFKLQEGVKRKMFAELRFLQGKKLTKSVKKKEKADLAPDLAIERATLPRGIEAPHYETGEAVSLTDIRKFLETALDIPIRLGVGRRKASGLFRPKEEVIRMKLIDNIPTIAHEVGHYLHYIMFPRTGMTGAEVGEREPGQASTFNQRFDDELMELGKATSRASYEEDQVRREGVAEFVREYLTHRPNAVKRAPKFHRHFADVLKDSFPEINKILAQATDMIETFVNQSGYDTILSMMKMEGHQNPGEKGGARQKLRQLYTRWVNELAPLERTIKQLESYGLKVPNDKRADQLAINYMGGWLGKVEHTLRHGQVDYDGNVIGPSLEEVLSGVENLTTFQVYLVAQRALEKTGQGLESGLTASHRGEDSNQLIEKYQKFIEENREQYEPHRLKLQSFLTNELEILQDAGFISQEEFERILEKNEFYVPFHRVHERVGSSGGRTGKGFLNLAKGGLKGYTGAGGQIVPPLESVVKNLYVQRDLVERNRVAQSFIQNINRTYGGGRVADQIVQNISPTEIKPHEVALKLKKLGIIKFEKKEGLEDLTDEELVKEGGYIYRNAETGEEMNPDHFAFRVWRASRTESDKEGKFSVWFGGKRKYYQMDDAELFRAMRLQDSTAAEITAAFTGFKAMSLSTRVLRAGATLTIDFIERNPFRDQLQAAVYSKHGFIPFFDGFRGMLSVLGKDKYYKDWLKGGGRYSDFVATDRGEDIIQKLKDISPGNKAYHMRKWLNPIRTLQAMSELMETATRVQEYKNARKRGKSDLEAVNAAKDVTLNFSRFGWYGKSANQIFAFYNAKMQDWDKIVREHRGPNKFGVMQKAFMYITVPSIITWWLGKDDERIQNLPWWRKKGFWNINLDSIARMAGMETEGKDFVFSLPKPFLIAHLYGTSVESALDYAFERDPNAVKKWFIELSKDSPAPFAWTPDNWFLNVNTYTPTIARPVAEAIGNKSLHTGRPLESLAMEKLPTHMRFHPQTSELMKKLAEWGAIASDGQLSFSPIKLDNMVRGYLGGLGREGVNIVDFVMVKTKLADIPPAPKLTVAEWPGIRAFAQSPYEASDKVRQFYEASKTVEERIQGIRAADWEKPNKLIVKEGERMTPYLIPLDGQIGGDSKMTAIRQGREALGLLTRAATEVQLDKELSPALKTEKLLELGQQRDDLAARLLDLFEAHDRLRVR